MKKESFEIIGVLADRRAAGDQGAVWTVWLVQPGQYGRLGDCGQSDGLVAQTDPLCDRAGVWGGAQPVLPHHSTDLLNSVQP